MEHTLINKTPTPIMLNVLLFFISTIMFWLECGYSILYHANNFIAGYLILISYFSIFVYSLKDKKITESILIFLYLIPMFIIVTQIVYNIR